MSLAVTLSCFLVLFVISVLLYGCVVSCYACVFRAGARLLFVAFVRNYVIDMPNLNKPVFCILRLVCL